MNTEIFTKMRTTTQAIDPRRSVLAEPQSAMLDKGTFEGAFDPFPQRRSEVKSPCGHGITSKPKDLGQRNPREECCTAYNPRCLPSDHQVWLRTWLASLWSFHMGLWKCPTITWVRDPMRWPLSGLTHLAWDAIFTRWTAGLCDAPTVTELDGARHPPPSPQHPWIRLRRRETVRH
jgi:hypothetical protein